MARSKASTEQGKLPISAPQSVFITGASGFIGRALGERYRALGAEVRGMDLRADKQNGIVAGNLTDPKSWAKHAKGCELFINTAAIVSTNAPWQLYRDVTIQGVRNALDVAIAGGAKRFLHYSTVAVLGWESTGDADEKQPVIIGEQYRYGVAKGASEHAVLAAHAAGEIACTIVRPGDVYGPGSRAWLNVPLEMCRKGMMTLPANGEGLFSPVYIDDLLDGTMLAAGLDAGSGNIFHISGGHTVSCKEFFSNHWHWAGRSGSPRCVSTPVAVALTSAIEKVNRLLGRQDETGPDAMYMLARKGGYSIAKAQRLLGYQPQVGLAEGLQRSAAWLRETGEIQ
ncbi:NAD-dependent epimerase/dehydratase family protein [Pseudomonas sp. N040]|uniref:NAD-dependent epimerase/dehydratase family protein n=1 Tax=Pseudomonas sp. N040 TaxID=2785325 RepID=UPI0018A2991C|nr:NAD-dependent epimerase/dehydratase family protein [Pseudomonas sp. N040]MBF7729094.1 NAD-dependent epimerase/dehydratase family protein [Pseudomonas sp. N040]MBW7012734.1 NAD-dependent epimerase/dehydratase family protein [Pseudomonas sp. N040]